MCEVVIIKTACKRIMNAIKHICNDTYPSYIENMYISFMSPKFNLDVVPTSLHCLFRQLIESKDWKRTIASLCQAVKSGRLAKGYHFTITDWVGSAYTPLLKFQLKIHK